MPLQFTACDSAVIINCGDNLLQVNDLVDEVQEQARASAARKKKQNRAKFNSNPAMMNPITNMTS